MKKIIMENYITRFIRYIIDWRKTRGIIRQLQSLDDKILKDIGISRHDIYRLAYTKVQKDRNMLDMNTKKE